MAVCTIAQRRNALFNFSCRAPPASATRSTTSPADQARGREIRSRREGRAFQSNPGVVMPSPWGWKQYGQCGKWVSDLLPHIGRCVDDIAFIHSMCRKSNVHGPATFMQNTGFILPGFPSTGAGVVRAGQHERESAGLRCPARSSRVAAERRRQTGRPGFFPAAHQATMIRVGTPEPDLRSLPARIRKFITRRASATGWRCWRRSIDDTTASARGDSRLDARIASYEMAARLQLSAPEVLDMSRRVGGDAASSTAWIEAHHRGLWASVVWSRGGCSSAAFASCRSGAARTTASRAGTGTATRISLRTTANWAPAWTSPSPACSRT